MWTMTKLNTSKTEWDLSPLLSGPHDPKIAEYRTNIQKATDDLVAKWTPKLDQLSDPATMLELLTDQEGYAQKPGFSNEGLYFSLLSTIKDGPVARAGEAKADEFMRNISISLTPLSLAITTVPAEHHQALLNSPCLAPYRHYLERAFSNAPYVLGQKEERVASMMNDTSLQRWIQMLEQALAKAQKPIELADGTIKDSSEEELIALLSNPNKPVRDRAAAAFNEMLAEHADMATAELNAVLAYKKTTDQLRGYDRPDASRHLSDDLPSSAVDALIKAVSGANLIPHRYYRLKADLLGFSKLAYHERSLSVAETTTTYSYADGAQLVHQVIGGLDPEFGSIIKRLAENGQIDVFPRQGKRGGAFCMPAYSEAPTYVMLNWTDKLRDVTTLAHELGHAIHGELTREHQTPKNRSMPMSTAEVASTFMEDFIIEQVLNDVDQDEERLAILITGLDDAVATIFRQIACYKFEQVIHERFRSDGYLSTEVLGQLFSEQMTAYMGEAVDVSGQSGNWWIYWSHIRMFFYVYSYSSGHLIAKALQSQVRADPQRIQAVKTFLSTGSSKSPVDTFADLGIDITDTKFWESGLKEIEKQLDEADKLARKLGKIK